MVNPVINYIVRWKLFPVYSLVLILLSVLPINSTGSQINHIFVVSVRLDYILHAMVYIPLTLFAWIDRRIVIAEVPFKAVVWIIVLLVFAVITEWIQYFLPYRAFNINDLIANCIGIIAGLFLVFVVGNTKTGLKFPS
ncbi:MAG: VanZ family protein [Bacteroidetes bacterium]|nr:VanZ family protein [Bacteroidota bacterium]